MNAVEMGSHVVQQTTDNSQPLVSRTRVEFMDVDKHRFRDKKQIKKKQIDYMTINNIFNKSILHCKK